MGLGDMIPRTAEGHKKGLANNLHPQDGAIQNVSLCQRFLTDIDKVYLCKHALTLSDKTEFVLLLWRIFTNSSEKALVAQAAEAREPFTGAA